MESQIKFKSVCYLVTKFSLVDFLHKILIDIEKNITFDELIIGTRIKTQPNKYYYFYYYIAYKSGLGLDLRIATCKQLCY
ncbi:hypothetical protein BpHYR1_012223 [Brachionus plicatilis]|uniref:Uncharacterized protein n=1 Tax=Brachionus plicatilis TaxID=10195 RepID=A0A3M7P1W2_BRAPC|nr:hypothetical protein BpHYR1_012223 [Brachionus plicatilis]